MTEVSQRARELLAAELGGSADDVISVINFAAHQPEIPVMKAALRAIDKAIAEERAAIVGWLRKEAAQMRADNTGWDCRTVEMRADAISRGEHHEG